MINSKKVLVKSVNNEYFKFIQIFYVNKMLVKPLINNVSYYFWQFFR